MEIGLVGCGRWGKNILRDLIALGCNVTVFEHSSSGREHARSLGVKRVFAELYDSDRILDGYIVAVQTQNHYQVLKELAPCGRPVFVEKPMVPDLDQAHEISSLMGNRVFVMHKWRYHPGVQVLAELRKSERFGKLQRLLTRRVQWGHPHKDVDALWILMPHDASIALHILGHLPSVNAVQAVSIDNRIDSVVALLGREPSVTIEVSAIDPVTSRLVCAFFDRAIVSLPDPLADHLEVRFLDESGRPTEQREEIPISTEWPLFLELKAFIEFINGGIAPQSSIEDELSILKILSDVRALVGSETIGT